MGGDAIEIKASINLAKSSIFSIKVLSSGDGKEETTIKVNNIDNNIEIDFANSSLDSSVKHFKRTMGHKEMIATK